MQHETDIRVLVYSDDEPFRYAVTEYLKYCGYKVIGFPTNHACILKTGETCSQTNGNSCGDVVLFDLEIPFSMVLRYVSNHFWKGCKVLHYALITKKCSPEELSRAHELQCEVFVKPARPKAIRKWLEDEYGLEHQKKLPDTSPIFWH